MRTVCAGEDPKGNLETIRSISHQSNRHYGNRIRMGKPVSLWVSWNSRETNLASVYEFEMNVRVTDRALGQVRQESDRLLQVLGCSNPTWDC